ncbi:MAG TPA: hypothetical protein VLA72_14310 [Anaerolineales bacterium]|nr:hypothetical protein [Anaerolineales bacterium]
MLGLQNQDILQFAVQRFAQSGERFQIDMTGCSRIEAIDEILGNARYFGQLARGDAFAGFSLLLSE